MNNRVRGLQLADIPTRSELKAEDVGLIMDRLGIVRSVDKKLLGDELSKVTSLWSSDGAYYVIKVEMKSGAIWELKIPVAKIVWASGTRYYGGIINDADYEHLRRSWYYLGELNAVSDIPKASSSLLGAIYRTSLDGGVWVCLDRKVWSSRKSYVWSFKNPSGTYTYMTGIINASMIYDMQTPNENGVVYPIIDTSEENHYARYMANASGYILAVCDVRGNLVYDANGKMKVWCFGTKYEPKLCAETLDRINSGVTVGQDMTEVVVPPTYTEAGIDKEGEPEYYWELLNRSGEGGSISGGNGSSDSGSGDSGGGSTDSGGDSGGSGSGGTSGEGSTEEGMVGIYVCCPEGAEYVEVKNDDTNTVLQNVTSTSYVMITVAENTWVRIRCVPDDEHTCTGILESTTNQTLTNGVFIKMKTNVNGAYYTPVIE